MLSFELVWFDSLGAKSSCTFVSTDRRIVIDPGAAIMHRSFPAPEDKKRRWLEEAKKRVTDALGRAEIVIISHYHHDHYFYPGREALSEKTLILKDPNAHINRSQRKRAEIFIDELLKDYGKDLGYVLGEDEYRIEEFDLGDIRVRFADGKEFLFGETKVRFSEPLFHGIEHSKLGWVISTVIEYGGKKLIHSSDVNGPIVEGYADWILSERPDVLILDGPMTYMLGYLLSRSNLERAIRNAVRIVEDFEGELMIYDHHLTRDPKFRERTEAVWSAAERLGKRVMTAAEYMGRKPVVLGC